MFKKRAHNFINRIGSVFGRLTVIEFDMVKKGGIIFWLCKCECNNIVSVRSSQLIGGGTRSCGCLTRDVTSALNKRIHKTHGMRNTRFYQIWHSMKSRCLNPNVPNFNDYGGRGIIVCNDWLKFENFRDDLYESYLKHVEEFGEENTSLDRFPNNDGNYELGNVRWATRSEQGMHTRVSTKTENHKEHLYWKSKLQIMLNDVITKHLQHSTFFEQYIGCSIAEFKQYIESQFIEDMTWSNHGHGIGKWEFDHILGCNNFDLSTEENRKNCFIYTNLKPTWWEVHVRKSTKRVA